MKQLSIEILQKCVNHCLYCSSCSCLDSVCCIPFNDICHVIDDMPSIGMDTLCLSGGEPFLHKDLLLIVKYAKERGISVVIYTCGVLENEHCFISSIPDAMLQELKDLGVDKIIFSLSAIDDGVYDRITDTHGHLPYVLQSIKNCLSCGIFTELHVVPLKLNLDQLDKILDFALDHKINRVSFLGFVPHGRGKLYSDQLSLSDEHYAGLIDRLAMLSKSYSSDFLRVGIPLQKHDSGCSGCHAYTEKLCIRYDGAVFGCETFKHLSLYDPMGQLIEPDSIYKRPLREIYADSEHLKAEQTFIRGWMCMEHMTETCPVQRMFRREVSARKNNRL